MPEGDVFLYSAVPYVILNLPNTDRALLNQVLVGHGGNSDNIKLILGKRSKLRDQKIRFRY